MDCLELAIECNCKHFVNTSTVQNIMDKLWISKTNDVNVK